MTTLERVIAIAAAVLNVPTESVQAQSSPDDISTWDSIRHLQIIVALEEAFDTRFSTHEIDQLQTVSALAEALERRP